MGSANDQTKRCRSGGRVATTSLRPWSYLHCGIPGSCGHMMSCARF